ncbi:hypothetical protein KKI24_20625 [bacterium]|nr:hypothetical protein [bacterium]
MTPEQIAKISEIFSDPDPVVVAEKLNQLSRQEKADFAKSSFELTGKVFSSLLEPTIKTTFYKIFQSIGRMFFFRFPYVNEKLRNERTVWQEKIDKLKEVLIFTNTSDFDLLTITENIIEKDLKAEEPFMAQFEEVKGVFFVKEPVKVFEHNSKIASVIRNGIFGDGPCITGEIESSITAIPTSDCKALFIPREKFVELVRNVPGMQEKIFQDVVERSRLGSVRAEEQRRLIQEILDNIGQGSFSIDKAGEIGENYTKIAAEYLGVESLAGAPFADLAFRKDRKVLRNYYRALHMLFSGNQFDNAMVLDLLPKEITINQRILKLHYSFLQDGGGHVVSVFVRMEDLTLERELAAKEAAERTILSKMQQNIGGFMDMLNDAQNLFKLIEGFADQYWDKQEQPPQEYVREVMRTLHGSKGLSGQFELNKLKNVIHALEDWFLRIDNEGLSAYYDEFIDLFQEFEGEFQFAMSFKENLGEGIIKILDGVSFTKDEFVELTEAIKTSDLKTATTLILSRNNVSANRIISNWKKDTERLAEKLGKKVDFQVEIEEGLTVSREMAKTLNISLGHLYRNCVDHGVETPEQRNAAGKDETGRIYVKISRDNDVLNITIGDDGAGLDEEKIIQIARKKNDLDQDLISDFIDRGEYWRILFMAGFSSAENVTDVSGRGVGMDAVMNTLNHMNGSIFLETTLGAGTVFKIDIPMVLS